MLFYSYRKKIFGSNRFKQILFEPNDFDNRISKNFSQQNITTHFSYGA